MQKVTYLITYGNVCAAKVATKRTTNLFFLQHCRSLLHKCYASTCVVSYKSFWPNSITLRLDQWDVLFFPCPTIFMNNEKFHLHEYLIEWLISNSPASNLAAFIKRIREYSFITVGILVQFFFVLWERLFFTPSVWYLFTFGIYKSNHRTTWTVRWREKKTSVSHALEPQIFIEYSFLFCEKFN